MDNAQVKAAKYAQRVIEQARGRKSLLNAMEATYRDFRRVWERDTGTIGRLLRAHLTLEYFTDHYLAVSNPRLGSLARARLTFSQKIELLGDQDHIIRVIRPGLKQINQVRNKVAHRLDYQLSESDTAPLLALEVFRALRDALAKPGTPSTMPIDILEDFTRFAASILQGFGSELKSWIDAAHAEK